MSEELQNLEIKARLAEQAERYTDVIQFLNKIVAQTTEPLSLEQRNTLSLSYKNVNKDEQSMKREIVEEYRSKIQKELEDKCREVIEIVNKLLSLVKPSDHEQLVFYYKMKGDYYRYVAEVTTTTDWCDAAVEAEKSYEEAKKIATEHLPETHPIRLGLALNYSVFYYEIKNNPERACIEAKNAFDEAILKLDNLAEESYKDSTLIMQLLRDNLSLWSEGQSEECENPEKNE